MIPFQKVVKTLGVVFDHKLDWKEQVTSICKKANSLLYRLNFFRRSTIQQLWNHLIEALLFPIIDYCSLAICELSDGLNLKLQRVLNSGIRYNVFGLRKSEHITPYRASL